MNDSERLLKWMRENKYSSRTLAAKIGVTHTGIHYMTGGNRPVSDAFKWRFQEVFGHEIADELFRPESGHQDNPINTPVTNLMK